MIRVCITGAGSYIGTHIGLHLAQMPEQFEVAEMDVSQPWQPDGLRGFDAVIHVAGIAHRHTGTVNADAFRDCVNTVLASHQSAGVSSDDDLMALRNKLKERKGTNA